MIRVELPRALFTYTGESQATWRAGPLAAALGGRRAQASEASN